jgi:hypothetical protein
MKANSRPQHKKSAAPKANCKKNPPIPGWGLACQPPSSFRKTRRGREPQVHERERERTSGSSFRATLALLEILKV